MKTYTEQEVVELLKKMEMKFASNVNSDKWYKDWILNNENTPNIRLGQSNMAHFKYSQTPLEYLQNTPYDI